MTSRLYPLVYPHAGGVASRVGCRGDGLSHSRSRGGMRVRLATDSACSSAFDLLAGERSGADRTRQAGAFRRARPSAGAALDRGRTPTSKWPL